MDHRAIERILACKTLPSLPGVALQVLELTRDPGLPVDRIAKVVQNDPALAVKILRTVNSSYYGLTHRCPTISRAVAMLGVNTVRSLVLGFSLVEMSARVGKGFDLVAYWRRSVYSAAGARLIAKVTRGCDPEEAFIGALLQDVGMLAANAALGAQYDQVVATAPEDHDALCAIEIGGLGFDHAVVGAKLAEKWRLPPQLIESTRLHHKPEQASPAHAKLVHLVALGGDAAATLTVGEPREKLSRFLERASFWFGLEKERALALLQETSDGAAQLSSLLELKTGRVPDAAAILAEANERLVLNQIRVESESMALQVRNQELAQQAATDPLTGVGNRAAFDQELERRFGEAGKSRQPLALLFADADEFKAINDHLGHQVGDAVLKELGQRLKSVVGPAGTVYRYGGEEFIAVAPGLTSAATAELAERARGAMDRKTVDLAGLDAPAKEVRCTISIGAAWMGPDSPYKTPEDLVRAADDAVYAAKQAGRNCVRLVPAAGEATGARAGRVSILLVEEDPLAAKLLELMLGQRPDVMLRAVRSAAEAMKSEPGPAGPPDLVLIDPRLPGAEGLKLVRAIRSGEAWRGARVVVISSADSPADEKAAREAGADAFVSKAQFCANFGKWVSQIVEGWGRTRRAA